MTMNMDLIWVCANVDVSWPWWGTIQEREELGSGGGGFETAHMIEFEAEYYSD